jgi:hypothetical protein
MDYQFITVLCSTVSNFRKKRVIFSIFASRKYPNLEMKRDSPYLELVKRIDNSEEYPKNP